ncbi:MAG: outer membrane lipoprotein-sorting protein [Pseudoxanthomonas sp.]
MKNGIRSFLFRGTVALALLTLVHPGEVRADAAGDKALLQMEEAMNRAKTQSLDYDVANQEPGQAEKKLGISFRSKGEKYRIDWTAPADLKGTKTLCLSPTQMYVYLPAFGKVRHIASSATDQGFMGMTFLLSDFASRYTGQYAATTTASSATEVNLVATPKPGQDAPYAKIEFTIAKDRMQPTTIRYFNASGTNTRTLTLSNYTCQGNICTATEQKMVDNTKNAWTKLLRKTWKVNENISDDYFSQRALGE